MEKKEDKQLNEQLLSSQKAILELRAEVQKLNNRLQIIKAQADVNFT